MGWRTTIFKLSIEFDLNLLSQLDNCKDTKLRANDNVVSQ